MVSITLGDRIYLNFGETRIPFTHAEWAEYRLWMNVLGIQVEKEIEDMGHRDGYDGEPVTLIGGSKDD